MGKKVEHYLFNFLPPVEVFVGGPSGWAWCPPHSLVDELQVSVQKEFIPFPCQISDSVEFFSQLVIYGLSEFNMRESRGDAMSVS